MFTGRVSAQYGGGVSPVRRGVGPAPYDGRQPSIVTSRTAPLSALVAIAA
jgi:hypothetical protein